MTSGIDFPNEENTRIFSVGVLVSFSLGTKRFGKDPNRNERERAESRMSIELMENDDDDMEILVMGNGTDNQRVHSSGPLRRPKKKYYPTPRICGDFKVRELILACMTIGLAVTTLVLLTTKSESGSGQTYICET